MLGGAFGCFHARTCWTLIFTQAQRLRWRCVNTPFIPFPFQSEIRREAADSALARQGEATTYRFEMEMESGHPPFKTCISQHSAAVAGAGQLQPVYRLHLRGDDGQVVLQTCGRWRH